MLSVHQQSHGASACEKRLTSNKSKVDLEELSLRSLPEVPPKSSPTRALFIGKVSLKQHAQPHLEWHRSKKSWPERVTPYLVKFWYCDLSPLSGPLRMFYYGFLFFNINWGDNFWTSGGVYHFQASVCREKAASLVFYRELGFQMKVDAGVLGKFFASLQDPTNTLPCGTMAWTLRLSLFCSSIGLGGRLPRFMAASLWLFMVALGHAAWGDPPGHAPNLPAVALISLCFAENNLFDRWSLDHLLLHLSRRVSPSGNKAELSWRNGDPSIGGAARKLVLVQAVLVMFFAGVHKMSTWGVKWLSGATIGLSIRYQRTRSPWLKMIVLEKIKFLPTVLASTSVVGELLAVTALLSPRWRPCVVMSWAMFHLGIFLLMNPNFLMQAMTYSLVVDWGQILPRVSSEKMERGCAASVACQWPLIPTEQPLVPTERSKVSSNMKLGAWLLTAIALVMFLASFLRIDYFPLASYSLYNWHPTEPGFNGKMFTSDGVKSAAHRCVTEPPLNPTCQNLGGQGTTHENKFHSAMSKHLQFVTIVGNKLVAKEGLGSVNGSKCPIMMYHSHYFKPFVCWKPDMNGTAEMEMGRDGDFLPNLLQLLLTDPMYLNGYKYQRKRKPRNLEGGVYSLNTISNGLSTRLVDAAGSAIAEGGLTCLDDPEDGISTRMPDPYNSASRFSRQMRTHMGPNLIGRDLQTLAVGLILGYGKKPSDRQPSRWCVLGSSVIGEIHDSMGNHEVGASSSTRAKLPKPGLSGWFDVIKGGFIVLAAVGCLALRECLMLPRAKEKV